MQFIGLVAGRPFDQVLVRVETVHAQLGRRRKAVRRKRLRFDYDLVPAGGRPVKTGHEQVQVDRQRVHRNDLGRFRAGQLGETLRCLPMVG